MPKSDVLLGKNVPFVQAYHMGRKQRPTAIVIRTSFTTGEAGAALGIAKAWHSPRSKIDSCHYVIDEFQTFCCVPDQLESKSMYTLKTNRKSITINICFDPPQPPLDNIVYRTAKQTARLCRLHRIRPRIMKEDEVLRWIKHPWRHQGGIIIATLGDFPVNRFFSQVEQEYQKDY